MHKVYIEAFVEGKLSEKVFLRDPLFILIPKAKEMEGQSMIFSMFQFAKEYIATLEELHNGSFAFLPADILSLILAHSFLSIKEISMMICIEVFLRANI
jgi:hypothetical protein